MPVANERVSQRSRQRQKSWHEKWIPNRRCERSIDYGIQTNRPYIQTARFYIQTARPYVQTVRPDTSNLTVNRGKWPGRRHPRQTRVCLGRERGRDLLPRAPVLVRAWHPGSLPSSRVLNADDEPRLTRSEGDKVIASPRLRNASVLPPHPILPTIVRRQYARRIAQAGRGNVHCGGCDCNGEGVKCLATKKEARDRAALPSSDSVTNTSRLVRGPILVSPPDSLREYNNEYERQA